MLPERAVPAITVEGGIFQEKGFFLLMALFFENGLPVSLKVRSITV